jgi:hypothetical protein
VLTIIETKLAEFETNQIDKSKGQEPSWADIVGKHVDSKMEKVSENLIEVQKVLDETKTQALEEKDKQIRSNNIIIYRIPEGDEPREERTKMDKSFCTELIADVLEIDLHDGDIVKMFRLGKKGDIPRPFLVQLRERETKNKIMESLSKLRQADDKFKNISITHDMTKKERTECKLLVEEAKKKQDQDQGEWIYRVRGLPGLMKIIKLAKK